jgi:hypothetical protein
MDVKAKFRCELVEDSGEGKSIRLSPVVAGSKENDKFFKATPGGEITLNVVNPTAAREFEVGAEYYVEFKRAKVKSARA